MRHLQIDNLLLQIKNSRGGGFCSFYQEGVDVLLFVVG